MRIQKSSSLSLLFTILCLNTYQSNDSYPETKAVKQVDDYHGVKVEDPYQMARR
jgi:hypothetical protein